MLWAEDIHDHLIYKALLMELCHRALTSLIHFSAFIEFNFSKRIQSSIVYDFGQLEHFTSYGVIKKLGATIMDQLKSFRAEEDSFIKSHPQSPLTHNQKSHFDGLNYFPENPDLRLEVNIEEFPQKDTLEMQTTTGGVQTYRRYGKFRFMVEDQETELTIYASHHDFFLPFADSLAGTETYGAGRYLEPESLGDGKFLVDFNFAYNPYCAYHDAWSCPITPFENRIKVPICAGEKVFKIQSVEI
jgi:uncharacterized protein (DUF1684 family)